MKKKLAGKLFLSPSPSVALRSWIPTKLCRQIKDVCAICKPQTLKDATHRFGASVLRKSGELPIFRIAVLWSLFRHRIAPDVKYFCRLPYVGA